MQIRKEINTIIMPLVRGLPIIIGLVVLAILFTKRSISYSTVEFEASGSIRLDNNLYKPLATQLFEGSKSNISNNFLTEVEVFKSRFLIERALEKLDFNVTYYRKGKLQTTELFGNNPFTINYSLPNKLIQDHEFFLKYAGNGKFYYFEDEEMKVRADSVYQDKLYVGKELIFTIHRNDPFLKKNPSALKAGDVFAIKINSLITLASNVNDANYFVRTIDKEIDIVKVYYRHEVPEKAVLLVNRIFEAFIEESIRSQAYLTKHTLEYIDERLKSVSQKLKDAEGKLAGFKAENGIVNALQETDATLKELMQLDFKRINLDVQEAELTRLFDHIKIGEDLQEFSPNFEALNDPIFKEAFMKIQRFELEKKDLLLKFTPESEEVVNLITKTNNLQAFIHESVDNTLKNLQTKKSEINDAIEEVNNHIKDFPDKERQTVVLQREVKIQEELYSQLVGKRTELAIAGNSSGSLHKILDRAVLPKKHIWPNKPMIFGAVVFMALLVGIGLAYLVNYLFATIKQKSMLSEMVSYPIVGTVSKVKKGDKNPVNAFANLYTSLEILASGDEDSVSGKVVLVSSMFKKEGKTFTVINLAKALATIGRKVLVIDMDIVKPTIHEELNVENTEGLGAIMKKTIEPKDAIVKTDNDNLDVLISGELDDVFSALLFSPLSLNFIDDLKLDYDFILIDTPPLSLVVDAIPLMHRSDYNFFIYRAGRSKLRKIKWSDEYLQEFKIPNLYLVLNGIKSNQSKYSFKKKQKNKRFTQLTELME